MEPIEMWQAKRPREGEPASGFPAVDNVKRSVIFRATRETGGYNHHCRLIYHGGRFFSMWSNHPRGEGAPGMRVLFASSKDAYNWSDWQVLFPRPAPVGEYNALGLAATPGRWLAIGGKLFATCGLFSTTGFSKRGLLEPVDVGPVRDELHPSKVRETFGYLARSVHPDGSLGPIFALWDHMPPELDFEAQPTSERNPDGLWQLIFKLVSKPDDLPTFSPAEEVHIKSFVEGALGRDPADLKYRMHLPPAYDGHSLSEPTTFPASDGRHVLLARDPLGSHRKYVSFSSDGGLHWPPALPTNIPDSPSRTTCLVLEDGTVLLIGNQVAPRFEDAERRHYRRDPLTLSISPDGLRFTRVYAVRHGAPGIRISGIGGRGPGFHYPGAVIQSGNLHIMYSVGKEDIEVLTTPLAELLSREN